MSSKQPRLFNYAFAYGAAVTIGGAVANFFAPYEPGSPTGLEPSVIILWLALYLPALVLPGAFGWQVRDFGWGMGAVGLAVSVLAVGVCGGIIRLKAGWGLPEAAIEAFARTGEEVFSRGFAYFLFERAFRNWRYPWLWATIGSSLVFAGMHTTSFNEVFQAGRAGTPAAYVVAERFVNVFLGAIVLGLLRASTGSIVPGALVHAILGGGVLAVPFVVVFAAGMALWGHRRGESLFDGITKAMQRPKAA